MTPALVSRECRDCSGTGSTPDIYGDPERCDTCDGLGEVGDWGPGED